MMTQPITHSRILSALVIAFAMAAFSAQPAVAQSAKKLNCTGCVKSKQLKNNGIMSVDIRNGQVKNADLGTSAVNSAKIADGTVGTADLAGNAVTSAKIANGAVGNADLATNAVDSSKVQNNSLTGADIQDNSLTGSDVQNSSLTASDLAANSVGTSEVQDNSLTVNDLGPNSVGQSEIQTNGVAAAEIATGAVGSSEIGSSAVGASEVIANSIPATDLSNEAGADFLGGNQAVALGAGNSIVRIVTVSAPTGGRVIVSASGYFQFSSAGNDVGVCSITTGTAVDPNNQIAAGDVGISVNFMPFAGTRGFNVVAGSTAFRLVCTEGSGVVFVLDSQITAIYLPTSY